MPPIANLSKGMTPSDIARLRLRNQQIVAGTARTPAEVVAGFGAMQAQEYANALWAIGLRLPGATEIDVERAVAERRIVRTWPMRGTLHFVAAEDVRWMLELMTPRIIAGSTRRWMELELSDTIFTRSRKVLEKMLQGGVTLTREVLLAGLEDKGISTAGGRAYHILWRHAQEKVICFGPREGKQKTFVLLDEWVPKSRKLSGGEALAELALRYFTSHGPATQADFVWWSGLKVADARAGIEAVASRLASETVEGKVYWMPGSTPSPAAAPAAHLLPGFDEFLLGYTDRSASLDVRHASKVVPGSNGIFLPMVVYDGKIIGTWKRTSKKGAVLVTAIPFGKFTRQVTRVLSAEAERYGKFLGIGGTLSL